jgi:hypothetical protein
MRPVLDKVPMTILQSKAKIIELVYRMNFYKFVEKEARERPYLASLAKAATSYSHYCQLIYAFEKSPI